MIFKVFVTMPETFSSYSTLERECDRLISDIEDTGCTIEIIMLNRDADDLLRDYAESNKYNYHVIQANYEKNGRAASHEQIKEAVSYSDMVIVFYDGISKPMDKAIGMALEFSKSLHTYPISLFSNEKLQ